MPTPETPWRVKNTPREQLLSKDDQTLAALRAAFGDELDPSFSAQYNVKPGEPYDTKNAACMLVLEAGSNSQVDTWGVHLPVGVGSNWEEAWNGLINQSQTVRSTFGE